MKRFAEVLAGFFLTASGVALAGDKAPSPFGQETDTLRRTEIMIDAARAFERVDVDQNGLVDEDEYASYRLVTAQLARFSGRLAIDGVGVSHLLVPSDVPQRLEWPEREAIDAVVRREFQVRAVGTQGLDHKAWEDAQLETFFVADRNGDDLLMGRELETFVRARVGQLDAGFPGT